MTDICALNIRADLFLKQHPELFTDEQSISKRINWKKEQVSIRYYTTNDIQVPFWKLWINKQDIMEERNVLLYKEAVVVASKLNLKEPNLPYGYC